MTSTEQCYDNDKCVVVIMTSTEECCSQLGYKEDPSTSGCSWDKKGDKRGVFS